jgi:hypothetical protein
MSEQPRRVQRRRTRGWRMPPNTIYVGRPSKWGNPFAKDEDPRYAYTSYQMWLHDRPEGQQIATEARAELRGKNLACWCDVHFEYCHADILLRIANQPSQIKEEPT